MLYGSSNFPLPSPRGRRRLDEFQAKNPGVPYQRETAGERNARRRLLRHAGNNIQNNEATADTQQAHNIVVRSDRRQTNEQLYTGQISHVNVGDMSSCCAFCSAPHFPDEEWSKQCCSKGSLSNMAILMPPQSYRDLFSHSSAESIEFLRNIREVNSRFAFASYGAKLRQFQGNGPPCHVISGQFYHHVGALEAESGHQPVYAQLWVIDNELAQRKREQGGRTILTYANHILDTINSTIIEYNPLVNELKHLHEEFGDQINGPENISVYLCHPLRSDPRRYNTPTSDQVSYVVETPGGEMPTNYDLMLYPRQGPIKRINCLSSRLDSMVYPLLFPMGDSGWRPLHERLPNTVTSDVRYTLMRFYSSRISYHPTARGILFSGCKLFQ
jgi:hypothetical protein